MNEKTIEYLIKLRKYLEISPVGLCVAISMYHEVTGWVIKEDVLMYYIRISDIDIVEFHYQGEIYLELC